MSVLNRFVAFLTRDARGCLSKALSLVILCEVFLCAAAGQQSLTPGATDGSPARLTATFEHNPPRIDLTDVCGKVVASHPLLKQSAYPLLMHALNKLPPFHIVNPAGTAIYVG